MVPFFERAAKIRSGRRRGFFRRLKPDDADRGCYVDFVFFVHRLDAIILSRPARWPPRSLGFGWTAGHEGWFFGFRLDAIILSRPARWPPRSLGFGWTAVLWAGLQGCCVGCFQGPLAGGWGENLFSGFFDIYLGAGRVLAGDPPPIGG